jgi:hypothetical protein
MKLNIEELRGFIVKAKKEGYASGKGKIPKERSQRPGFKELEFKEGEWYYRDSYSGFFRAPGQEVVYYKNRPVWNMCYGGKGQEGKYYDIAEQTFGFLKECLMRVPKEKPYRGPDYFKQGDFEYSNKVKGSLEDFQGAEVIKLKGKKVFSQVYFGGLIIHKSD